MGSNRTDENVAFGKSLKARRKGLGLTQSKLAGESGLTKGYISELERGMHSPSSKTITALCAALDCAAYELMDFPVSDTEKELLGLIRSMTEQQRKGLLLFLMGQRDS